MGDLGDYLSRKSAELGLERGDQLAEIQNYLDSLYPGQCRAVSINNGVLKITTPNASVASELRMRQKEALAQIPGITRLIIQVA